MGVTTTQTNKPFNPRGNDQSPKGYNRAKLFSGKALDFDGVNDYVSVADSDDLDGFTDFTLHAIVKADTFPNYCRIFDKDHTTAYNLAVNTNNELYMYAKNTAFSFDYVVPTGEYVSIVVAFTGGSKADLFINGQLEETIATSLASISSNSSGLYIGRLYSGAGSPWDGQISSPRIFDVALTAAQVADLYNNPEKVVPTGVDNTALKLWLPMMEGAGTTAYDGSGNGNHGTIAGATYVNGIGAPVAQSAVMDWNKGTNLVAYSQGFNNVYWAKLGASVTANAITAPDGLNNGFSLIEDTSGNGHQIQATGTLSTSTTYNISVFAKAHSSGRFLQFAGLGLQAANEAPTFDLVNGLVSTATNTTTLKNASIEDAGNGWYRCSAEVYTTGGANFVLVVMNNFNDHAGTAYTGDGTSRVHIWGAQVVQQATLDPYVRTGATAQTTPVLLPQGLTTGRDITGVNLFENVRKQGALNLDGNSWAEVHDNASLDVTTGLTIENWIYIEDAATQGRILSKWGSSQPNRSFQMFMNNAVVRFLIGDGSSQASLNSSTSLTEGNWHHIVSTYDGANIKIYINGSADATTTETFTIYNSNEPVLIGGYIGGANLSVNPIAQPRIYNRALTAEEVQRNYNSGKNTYTN